MKVIVVGCTHAGTSAVKTILKENPGTELTVYERKRQRFIPVMRDCALRRRCRERSTRIILF